jgi:hypothetical protein
MKMIVQFARCVLMLDLYIGECFVSIYNFTNGIKEPAKLVSKL